MTRREYRGNAQSTTISAALNIGDYTITVASLTSNTDWPTGDIGPFFVVVNRGQNNEEKILCSSRTGATITVSADPDGRGSDETSEGNHANNSSIEHVFTATDANEANLHIQDTSTTNVHGIVDTSLLLTAADLGSAAFEDVPFIAANIATNAITTAKIVDLNVTTAKIAADAVTNAKIADDAVDTAQIVAGAVGTAEIDDASITTAKIAADAVTTAKILNENVTTGKITDLAVTTAKINASAVTTAKIADDAVTTAKIDDDAVTSAKIATGTIVNSNIDAAAAIAQSKISGLTTDLQNRVLSANGVNDRILASGDGSGTIASGSAIESVIVNYASAGFTAPPDVVACMAENTLRTIGVVSRTASQVTFQIRNTAGNVGSNTPFTFFWIATGI